MFHRFRPYLQEQLHLPIYPAVSAVMPTREQEHSYSDHADHDSRSDDPKGSVTLTRIPSSFFKVSPAADDASAAEEKADPYRLASTPEYAKTRETSPSLLPQLGSSSKDEVSNLSRRSASLQLQASFIPSEEIGPLDDLDESEAIPTSQGDRPVSSPSLLKKLDTSLLPKQVDSVEASFPDNMSPQRQDSDQDSPAPLNLSTALPRSSSFIPSEESHSKLPKVERKKSIEQQLGLDDEEDEDETPTRQNSMLVKKSKALFVARLSSQPKSVCNSCFHAGATLEIPSTKLFFHDHCLLCHYCKSQLADMTHGFTSHEGLYYCLPCGALFQIANPAFKKKKRKKRKGEVSAFAEASSPISAASPELSSPSAPQDSVIQVADDVDVLSVAFS
jgi:hypothetical protein